MKTKKWLVLFLTLFLFCNFFKNLCAEENMLPYYNFPKNLCAEENMIHSIMNVDGSLERADRFKGGNFFALMTWVEEGYYSENNSQNVAYISPEIKDKIEKHYREIIFKTLQPIFAENQVRDVEVSILSDGINVKVNIDGEYKFKFDENGSFIILSNGLRERVYTPISQDTLNITKLIIKNIISHSPYKIDTIIVNNIMVDRTKQFEAEDLSFFRQQKIRAILFLIIVGVIIIGMLLQLLFFVRS